MKEILRQITSLCMAFMVMFSTLSFTVDMHYCGDLLVDYSFFEAADGCGMEANQPEMNYDNSFMEMSMDCCTDLEIVMEGQDDLKISVDQLTFEQQIFVTAFFYTYINLYKGADKDTNSFNEYSPPPLIRDIQILDQTFLI